MSNKRTLLSTSPDQNKSNKKYLFCNKMTDNNQQDVFSWSKLCNVLDEKLKDVAKKEDLVAIKAEMQELKQENMKLKDDIKKLTTRMEFIDRRSRTSNIIVSGLLCTNSQVAKNKFRDICIKELNVEVRIISARILALGKSFVFSLESSAQAVNILAAKGKLRGQEIYIQKDYTDDEQSTRYKLRQLSKTISKTKKDVKVRLGEFCIFINDKKFTWYNGKVMASSVNDSEYLRKLLGECGCTLDVCFIDNYKNNNISNAISSSLQ